MSLCYLILIGKKGETGRRGKPPRRDTLPMDGEIPNTSFPNFPHFHAKGDESQLNSKGSFFWISLQTNRGIHLKSWAYAAAWGVCTPARVRLRICTRAESGWIAQRELLKRELWHIPRVSVCQSEFPSMLGDVLRSTDLPVHEAPVTEHMPHWFSQMDCSGLWGFSLASNWERQVLGHTKTVAGFSFFVCFFLHTHHV